MRSYYFHRFALLLLALTASCVFRVALADDGNAAADNDDGANAEEEANDDGAAEGDDFYDADGDDGMNYENQYGWQDNKNNYDADDGYYIRYWTDYAILPKRCITYNNADVIVFSVFENGSHHCTDTPVDTYISTVPHYLQGYLKQKEQDMLDQGYEDYELPEVSQYAYCTPMEIQNQIYYFQIGCADGTTQELAVNIYEDNTCTTRSYIEGYDDANIDVSDLQIPFKKCTACVNWFDMNDDAVDDGFYENRMTNAPLCQTAWTYKEECGRKCQHIGIEKSRQGWTSSDQVLLAILTVFGLIMLGLIVKKRQKMSNKDTLLEQAAMSAAGLQQPHVIGIFVLVVLVIAVFALLGLKNITWALLLIINTAMFAYLMKLTISSSVAAGETMIGPDGEILRQDSDDSDASSTDENKRGTYSLPKIA